MWWTLAIETPSIHNDENLINSAEEEIFIQLTGEDSNVFIWQASHSSEWSNKFHKFLMPPLDAGNHCKR